MKEGKWGVAVRVIGNPNYYSSSSSMKSLGYGWFVSTSWTQSTRPGSLERARTTLEQCRKRYSLRGAREYELVRVG